MGQSARPSISKMFIKLCLALVLSFILETEGGRLPKIIIHLYEGPPPPAPNEGPKITKNIEIPKVAAGYNGGGYESPNVGAGNIYNSGYGNGGSGYPNTAAGNIYDASYGNSGYDNSGNSGYNSIGY